MGGSLLTVGGSLLTVGGSLLTLDGFSSLWVGLVHCGWIELTVDRFSSL